MVADLGKVESRNGLPGLFDTPVKLDAQSASTHVQLLTMHAIPSHAWHRHPELATISRAPESHLRSTALGIRLSREYLYTTIAILASLKLSSRSLHPARICSKRLRQRPYYRRPQNSWEPCRGLCVCGGLPRRSWWGRYVRRARAAGRPLASRESVNADRHLRISLGL